MLLAVGIAGVVAGDRGLDFSLVWLPLELLVLTKARADARWLLALPLLCVAWVNTHGSILIGLLVLGVELAWSLAPARLVERLGGVRQSPRPGLLALSLLGSLVASCITPYGPGLLAYDVDVARNPQIAQYIDEWNSPDFHSLMTLLVFLVPLAVLVACVRIAADTAARGDARLAALRRGAADAAARRLPDGRRGGAGGQPSGPAPVGSRRRAGGRVGGSSCSPS